MARRRGRDRVVGLPATGGPRFLGPNGTLPRSTYRDLERSGTDARNGSVYRFGGDPFRSARQTFKRLSSVQGTVAARRSPGRWRVPPVAKQILDSVSWRPVLRDLPSRVRFCVQRKRRREVLFALNKAGYRGSAPKRSYRRNSSSNYGC